jgi:hypothetical protein
MTITTIKKTTKYFTIKDGEPEKEPEVKEKTLSEFKTTNEISSTFLEMLLDDDINYKSFNKNGDLEIERYISSNGKIEEQLIIKFTK